MRPTEAAPVRVDFSSGHYVTLELLRAANLPAAVVAEAVHLPTDQFLAELERWATGPGMPHGVTVDRERQTYSTL